MLKRIAATLFLILLNTGIVLPVMAWAQDTVQAKPEPVELDRIVAVVNDDIIASSELDREVANVKMKLRQRNTHLPSYQVLRKQVLEHMIDQRLQLQIATRSGIRVDDETLNRTLSSVASQNGLTLQEFRDVLENDGFSFEKFREDMRQELITSRLQQREISERITVTDREVAQYLESQRLQGKTNDQYLLGHILIAVPEAASSDQIEIARNKAKKVLEQVAGGADFQETAIASSDGPQALQGGLLGWREPAQLPTLFAKIVPQMEVGQLSDIIRSPSGFHIIKLLNYRNGKRHIVQETQARHILIKTNALVTDQEAKKRLSNYRQQVLDGADFADLARRYSEDSTTAKNGGQLKWVKPGDLAPEFEKEMNSLNLGEISEPFRTQFGWHIAQVVARRAQDDTEEYQRTRARDALRRRKIEEESANWVRRLRDNAYIQIRL